MDISPLLFIFLEVLFSLRFFKKLLWFYIFRIVTFLKKIYLFIFGCVGSSFLCEGFLQLRRAGTTLHRGAQASHYRGLSCCRAQAPDTQAQQLWLTGLVAPRHVGSSQTRARTRVPCIGQADSQPLHHQGSPELLHFYEVKCTAFSCVISSRSSLHKKYCKMN